MITAAQARELSGPGAEEYLAELDKLIRNAATAKLREVYVRTDPYAGWLYDERKLDAEPKKALKALRDAGFNVSFYYSDGSQFTDMALVIKW